MLAQLLIASDLADRQKAILNQLEKNKLTNPHPDLLYFDHQQKLGVEQTKQIRSFLSIKPYSALGRVVVLESAHNLTPDAQNSLLKVLEEPPETTLILLGGENEDQFLGTVLSRCEVVRIEADSGGASAPQNDIERLINSSLEERFKFVEKLEEREQFLAELISYFREKMHQDPKNAKFVKLLLQAEEWSKANVYPRAILEYLMLEM